jgi:hypothetical protein
MFVLVYLSAIVSLSAVLILQYFWRHRRFYRLYNKIPLADGNLPLIGFGWRFIKTDPKSLFKGFNAMTAPSRPSPRRLYSGPAAYITVDDPDHIQKLFSSKNCVNKIFVFKKFVVKSGQWINANDLEPKLKLK